jgi:hypothetical protein
MRWLTLVLLAGCAVHGIRGEVCQLDSDCGDYVCTRDGTCEPSSEVRVVKVIWTVDGLAADAATCTQPNLYLQFDGSELSDFLGIQPVPCRQGQLDVDKLPFRYHRAELGPTDAPPSGTTGIDMIDDHTGLATLNLFL